MTETLEKWRRDYIKEKEAEHKKRKRSIITVIFLIILLFVVFVVLHFLAPVAGAQEIETGGAESAGKFTDLSDTIVYEFEGAGCRMIRYLSTADGRNVGVDVTGEDGIEVADAMICTTTFPLMTERYLSYGRVERTQQRGSSLQQTKMDDVHERKLTAAGRQFHHDLMAFKVDRLFGFYSIIITYNSVTLISYEPISWFELIKPIEKAFKRAVGIDAAFAVQE